MKWSRKAQEVCSRWQELRRSLSAHSVILHEGTDRRWSTEFEERVEQRLGDTWSIKSLDQFHGGFKFQEGNFSLNLKMNGNRWPSLTILLKMIGEVSAKHLHISKLLWEMGKGQGAEEWDSMEVGLPKQDILQVL